MPSKFALIKNEIKYMSKSKMTIILILITSIALAMGINSLNMTNDFNLFYIRRTSSTIAFNSVRFGVTISSILFALLTVLALDKDRRKRSKAIIELNIDYLNLLKARIFSIVFYAFLTTIVGMIFVVSIQKLVYSIPIDISYYLFSYFLVFLPTILFSILIVAGLYFLTESVDMSMITFGVIFIKGLTSRNYLLAWVRTNINIISDFAGIEPVGKPIVYNRLLWFFISLSMFCVGLLFRRRYESGLKKSALINMKRKTILVLSIFLIFSSGFIYIKEPYTMDLMINFPRDIDENIYLKGIYPEVDFSSEKGEMTANVSYSFINKSSNTINFKINNGLNIWAVKVNGKEVEYKESKDKNMVTVPIPNIQNIDIQFFYEGKIKSDEDGIGIGMPGYISRESIYLQEGSNWIFRPLVNKCELVNISGYYIAPEYLTMVTPGKLIDVKINDGKKKWIFEYKSHTTNIGAFAAKYNKTEINVDETTIEFYYTQKHEEYVKNMKIEEHIRKIMEYYIQNIGEYYSKEYPLKIAEVSIYKRGGHSSENVITFAENTINRDESLYSILNKNGQINDSRKIDIYANDIKLIAHEIAHQWWGTGVDFVEEDSWSSEGLANYFSYKYIEKEFGDMASSLFLDSWKRRVDELENYYYIKNNDMKEKLNRKFINALEMEKRKAELYYLMPLKLLKGEEIQGEKAFLEGIQNIYKKHMLDDLTYDEFLKEMKLTREVLEID